MADGERLGASFSIDTTNLRAGLQQADRLIRQSEANFREAAAGIDNWTKSEEGLTKRQKALTEQIDLQKNKIAALTAEKQKIIDKMQAEGKSQEEIDKAIDGVNKQITKESKALDKLEGDLDKTNNALEDMSNASENAGDEVENAAEKAEKASDGFTVMKGALANLVADGFRKAIDAAKEFASGMIEAAAAVKAEKSQYEQAFGEMAGAADKAVDNVASSTGILRERLTGTAASIYSFARSSGATASEAMELMSSALMATADSAAYYDKSLEDSAETLQSFLKGNFANDAALGLSATEFTRNAKAAELFGKEYKELSEIQKQQTLLKMVTDAQKLSGAMGQASRESDGFENVMGNVNETYRQFQAKVGTPVLEALIPVIQEATAKFQKFEKSINWNDFSKKASKTLNNLIKEGKTIAKQTLPTTKTALKVCGTAIKFVAENFNTLVPIVTTAVAAFTAFKSAMAITTAITAAKTAIAGLEAGVGLVTKAQTIWNAAMSANPIGAVVTAVALLTAGVVLLSSKLAETAESTDYLTESQREAVTAAKEAADAYKDTKKAADEMAAADLANIDHTKTLYKELQNLTDENGKVKEGYEARAQYILNELNDALGTEYSMNGNVIKSYKEIASSIDTVIEKKKAQILLQAYEESYKQAINNVAEAEKARATQAQELAKVQEDLEAKTASLEAAQKAYEESLSKGDSRYEMSAQNRLRTAQAAYDGTKETLDNLQAAYNETETSLYGYYSDINSYETASTLVLEGETGKAISYLNNLGSGFKTAASTAKLSAQDQRATLQQQVIDTEVNAQLMKEAYQNGVEGVSEEMVKTAEEQASAAKEEFLKVGGDITKGIAQGAEGEENTKWTLSSAMQRLVNSALRAAKKAAGIKSPSRLFKKAVGRFIGLGVAAGVDDSTKDTVASVKNQIKAIKRAYDVSDINDTIKGISSNMSIDSGNGTTGQPVIVNQTNNYSQAHSRYELYRSKQETAAAVRLALAGG